ncbi:hypothetical protein KEM48_009219 [Puccinia striiformis f. sp. tritici PST-130]|nr:hypothetical protein KEM48_009219 [Puccinia striiformis f. sp. tritici PST-130]
MRTNCRDITAGPPLSVEIERLAKINLDYAIHRLEQCAGIGPQVGTPVSLFFAYSIRRHHPTMFSPPSSAALYSTPTPPGSNDVEWSTGDISSTAPNGVQGLDPSGSMGTITRGYRLHQKNHAVLIRQLCKQLDRQHSECHLQTVDFNLLAVFIMQEFEDKLRIQRLVEMILNQFGDRTLSQNQPAQSEIPTETDPGNPSPKTPIRIKSIKPPSPSAKQSRITIATH